MDPLLHCQATTMELRPLLWDTFWSEDRWRPYLTLWSLSPLSHWHLCQALTRHFWQRWSLEYINSLKRYTKWHRASKNLAVGDVVVLREDNTIPMKWPLAKVVEVHEGKDGLVRVVSVKTSSGIYKRPITKMALLLPHENRTLIK